MDTNGPQGIEPGDALHPDDGNQPSAPIPYPQEWVEQVRLADGLEITIRPIRPDDAPRLQSGFNYLSSQSVYFRFLGSVKQISDDQARSYAELDYHRRMAFVASLPAEASLPVGEGEFLIGVARYAILAPDEGSGLAEFAVVVGDAYQKRGIGTLLMDRLIHYAAGQGITEIAATVHPNNEVMLRIIQKTSLPVEKKFDGGIWEMRVKLNS
jgi:acetyltransferase